MRKANGAKRLLAKSGAGKQRGVIQGDEPFLLLDDASGAGRSRLYRNAVQTLTGNSPAEVRSCLDRLRTAEADGLHAAGFIGYEAGHALEPRLERLARLPAPDAPPLLWFGLFEAFEEVGDVERLVGSAGAAWASPPVPLIGRADYDRAFARVAEHILDGDIYQANLTFRAEVRFGGSPAELYAALRARSKAPHGALVFTGAHWLLSFSPELFFSVEGRRATARPMKGTARRFPSADKDAAAAQALRLDEKQRAENLMIVDLMRNDLSRVCRPGTVEVPSLFTIETYPTVHQMTSTVVGELEEDRTAVDLIEAAFPCGSVTGAPKIRAMEILDGLEASPRGPYTGSIGRIGPDGASFNVAIRSLSIRPGAGKALLGLGSGVVADSRADEEWEECLAKGTFVNAGTHRFDLIETMAFDPHEGIPELERHLLRLKESAEQLGFSFDRHDARNDLQAATFRFREPKKIRLRLSRDGVSAIEARDLPGDIEEPVSVAIAPLPLPASDSRLRFKTSDRAFFDEARRRAGTFEVIFEDRDGFMTQGSFTSLFVRRERVLLTPPLRRPVMPGVLRARLIDEGRAREADLRREDLAGGFYIGNAVRGLIEARLSED